LADADADASAQDLVVIDPAAVAGRLGSVADSSSRVLIDLADIRDPCQRLIEERRRLRGVGMHLQGEVRSRGPLLLYNRLAVLRHQLAAHSAECVCWPAMAKRYYSMMEPSDWCRRRTAMLVMIRQTTDSTGCKVAGMLCSVARD
jgi:hypothetical protein